MIVLCSLWDRRVEYDLTPAGLALVPLIDALGDEWKELRPVKSRAA